MSARERALIAAVACAVHLGLLAPTIGQKGGVLYTDFGPEAIAIEHGETPYGDQELEYPPLSIPVIVGPALAGEGLDSYNDAFQGSMLAVDLAIVLMLALGLGGGRREAIAAVAVYTAGIVALSGIVLDGSDIDEAPLALSRFDLVPAALVLGAVLARRAARSAAWGALLAAGAGVKAYPLAALPALTRGERRPWAVAAGAGAVLLACAALVVALGGGFSSAITYHTERELQIESLAATPLEITAIDDVSAGATQGSGSFNFTGEGADVARAVSVALLVFVYGLLAAAGWRDRSIDVLKLATALLAAVVVLSPVLSPQFMFWLLPLSAAAYGFGLQNLILLAAFVATQMMLQYYARVVVDFDAEWVWRLAGRNTLLLAYLVAVCWPIVRRAWSGGERAVPGGPGS